MFADTTFDLELRLIVHAAGPSTIELTFNRLFSCLFRSEASSFAAEQCDQIGRFLKVLCNKLSF